MYVNLKQFNREEDNTRRAEQLAIENARQAERDGWDRQNQAELAGQRQRAAEMRQRVQARARKLAGATDDQGYDITPITGGMAPPSVNRQALDAYTPEQGAPAPSTGLVKRAGFKAPSYMDDELELIRGQMELAGVSGDNRQLLDAQKAYLQHKKQRTAMAIADHFDNADDAELDRVANTITQDKTNKITSVRDPKTGYFLLRSEEGTQRLNRKEMRDYLIAKANGNLDEMNKAQESAMGRAEKDNGREVQMIVPNNTAAHYGNQDATTAERLGLDRERYAELTNDRQQAKTTRMDEEKKLSLTQSYAAETAAHKDMMDVMKNVMPGEDLKVNPAYAYAQERLNVAKRAHFANRLRHGDIPEKAMAERILGTSKTPADVMASLQDLVQDAGVDYTDRVAALVEATPHWREMSQVKAGLVRPANDPRALPPRKGAPGSAGLTSMDLELLSKAGDKFNVRLPDGTTQLMSRKQMEQYGFRFPK